MLCPFAPHVCEEAWERLGHATPLSSTPWPSHDPARLLDETVTLAVQISGKLRGQVVLARGATREQALEAARGEPGVARHLEGMTVVKAIHVENRLLNLVVRPN